MSQIVANIFCNFVYRIMESVFRVIYYYYYYSNGIGRNLKLKKRKGSHVQADWKKCQPPPGLEPGTSVYHDQRSNR